jgi:hypothetical protein
MRSIKQLKKQIEQIKEKHKDIINPYYLTYKAKCGNIDNITIKVRENSHLKELQKGTEEFLKWERYILSHEAEKEAIEGNKDVFAIMGEKKIQFIDLSELED